MSAYLQGFDADGKWVMYSDDKHYSVYETNETATFVVYIKQTVKATCIKIINVNVNYPAHSMMSQNKLRVI